MSAKLVRRTRRAASVRAARTRRGFTIVELLVAMMIVSVGLLALLGSSTLATRTIARSRVSDQAAVFAANRSERLRATTCTSRTAAADTLFRGTRWIVINSWTFTSLGNSTWRVNMTQRFVVAPGRVRTDTYEMVVSCIV